MIIDTRNKIDDHGNINPSKRLVEVPEPVQNEIRTLAHDPVVDPMYSFTD
jgi:hypothetical protein